MDAKPGGRAKVDGSSLQSTIKSKKRKNIKVLLIGSGADAAVASELNLAKFTVCAINNAWRIPKKLDYHIYPSDWLPPTEPYPVEWLPEEGRITYAKYYTNEQRLRFGGPDTGLNQTMFFNAVYWILATLKPSEIYFIGCSTYYPGGQAHTFYGSGKPDPLRFELADLHRWFAVFAEHAANLQCKLINLGTANGIMPY